ncbi:MAG: alanine racemase [Gammaproteobacteria bacterium]|nr:alanine racemase [Gammaproteobacteria bacterium]MCP4091131.1 alanine racemase [Gammaproteobacteria bacterium]MCP4277343.1 alanine racemase [Gammaproteobacteria bacterium]MCP4831596.1 alanine racemase [Gammaproteobacteria bacterium]MCP4927819.1 alanine racemase [Gammaproteobacteria bacterium]
MIETSVAVIQPAAIRNNLQRVRSAAPGCRIMAVIKANAYGHGLIAVAQLLKDVDALAVARVSEGIYLREAGISQRIVVLEGCSQLVEINEAIQHQLEIVVHDPVHFSMLEAVQAENVLDVWLKLDTGMGRLGFPVMDYQDSWSRLSGISCVRPVIRLMTHLACADDPDNPATLEQLRQFGGAIGSFDGDVSVANSAGVLLWPQTMETSPEFNYRGDNWVRPGLALFGVSPFLGKSARDMGLKSAMTFESRLIAVKTIKRGAAVGYGSEWRASRDTVVGVAAVGYGDGYPRHLQSGTPVLVNGRRVALIGRVSMDMINLDLTDVPVANVGDRVVLWGGHLPIEEIATRAGTIPYELMCGLSRRVEYRMNEEPVTDVTPVSG